MSDKTLHHCQVHMKHETALGLDRKPMRDIGVSHICKLHPRKCKRQLGGWGLRFRTL